VPSSTRRTALAASHAGAKMDDKDKKSDAKKTTDSKKDDTKKK